MLPVRGPISHISMLLLLHNRRKIQRASAVPPVLFSFFSHKKIMLLLYSICSQYFKKKNTVKLCCLQSCLYFLWLTFKSQLSYCKYRYCKGFKVYGTCHNLFFHFVLILESYKMFVLHISTNKISNKSVIVLGESFWYN